MRLIVPRCSLACRSPRPSYLICREVQAGPRADKPALVSRHRSGAQKKSVFEAWIGTEPILMPELVLTVGSITERKNHEIRIVCCRRFGEPEFRSAGERRGSRRARGTGRRRCYRG